jgi:hypothetical protein
MNRREFIKAVLASLILSSCGKSSNDSNIKDDKTSIRFGLGNDPERMIDGYDPYGKRTLNTLNPNIVCMWINGAKDKNGKSFSPSMNYVRDWKTKGRFNEWSNLGYELMVITWENYDYQNPNIGDLQTLGDYHISNVYLDDIKELLNILKDQFKNKVYFALATEQSTYTACRYDNTCQNSDYVDKINVTTKEYFSKLKVNLLRAMDLIKNSGVNSAYGMSFGGWLVEFQDGIDFIKFFEPIINKGNAVFFQSMMENKSIENNGYGNPQRILKNCQFYSGYQKDIHLAHYMPNNLRADVVTDDMEQMSSYNYLKTLYNFGFKSFSFMDYGLLKDNNYECLDSTLKFRKLFINN